MIAIYMHGYPCITFIFGCFISALEYKGFAMAQT